MGRTSKSTHQAPRYRPDIDGLRAIAVLAVVAFHAFPTSVRGGFTGVDVFFVISGFLISGIIISSIDRGTFSFFEFYRRRVRRIFPALLLVLAACLLAGWFVLLAYEYEQLGKHTAAGAGFISNFAFWRESGYFDNAAETKPLLHLWSLGIEEQFYVFWPLLVWATVRSRVSLLAFALVVGAASFAINVLAVRSDPVSTFFLPHTRFWELLAGCALAFASRTFDGHGRPAAVGSKVDTWLLERIARLGTASRRHLICNVAAWTGVTLILCGLLALDRTQVFPGWWATLPVTGTFLVIAAGPRAWLNRVVLSNRLLVFIGLISFPLYLWHWPILSFARIVESGAPSGDVRAAAVLIALFLAWLTYQVLERPVRFGGHGRAKAAVLVVLMASLGLTGYYVFHKDGLQSREIAKRTQQLTDWRRDQQYTPTTMRGGRIEDLKVLRGQVNDGVLFIGDSLLGQYYPREVRAYGREPLPYYSTTFAARNHCHPLPGLDIVSSPANINCIDYWNAAIALARSAQFKRIVFGGSWAELNSQNASQLVAELKSLRSLGKEIVIIGQSPRSALFDPSNLAGRLRKKALWGDEAVHLSDVFVERRAIENVGLQRALGQVAANVDATLINPFDYLCPEGKCPALVNSSNLYIDDGHLRASYAAEMATFIDETIDHPKR